MNLAALSYLAGALSSIIVLLLLLGAHRGSALGRRLLVASGLTAVWAAVLALVTVTATNLLPLSSLANAARHAACFSVVALLVRPQLPSWLARVCFGLCAAAAAAAIAWALPGLDPRVTSLAAAAVQRLELLLAIAGLVLIEQCYRGADVSRRAAIRPLAIAAGGQFAYDLFLAGQVELFGGVHAISWSLRGLATAALMPLFVVGASRLSVHQERVFVSRHMVFYSTAILSVGIYLLAMATGGYYVRLLGGSWGPLLQLGYLLGAVAVLASLLVRGGVWRRMKVFIATHFYRNKFDYRVEWLRFIRTLSTPGDQDIGTSAIKAVAQIFSSPGGVLLLRDRASGRFHPYRSWPTQLAFAVDAQPLRPGEQLPAFLEERQWIIDIAEYRRAPQLYGNAALPEWILRAGTLRIVVPLLTLNRLDGLLLLQSPPEPFTMNFEDHDFLKTLGRHLAVHIGQHESDQQLAEARQFDTYNRLAAFVMHDLKNSVAQLQLLVSNAARHRHTPEFIDDAIETIANAVERMTRLIEQLRAPDIAGRVRDVELPKFLEQAIERARFRQPQPRLLQPVPACAVSADPERLGAVLDHVLRNAQEAAADGGNVEVSVSSADGQVLVTVADDGVGMQPEFVRERLFKPFDSTKGSKGMGIGAYQTREYVRYLGGDVEVQSSPGTGTRFSITLPTCQTKNRNS